MTTATRNIFDQAQRLRTAECVGQLRQPDGSYHDELLMGLWVKPEPGMTG